MRKRLTYLFATLVFNTAIGMLLTLLLPDFSLRHNLIFAHCIGLTFALASLFILAKYPSGRKRLAALVIALPICVTIGVSLAMFITDLGGWQQPWTGRALAIGLFFCLIGVIALLLAERVDAEVKQRQLLSSESEKRETEAHLKLLQAQIEPHFLFNTLANVSSLIDSDPILAKSLLERLNDWLRVALARARSEGSTLADELEMLENYLQIMKIRFGDRLCWHIEAPDEIRRQPFPPMLLQPLVENAVRHGIEPKLGGGEIGIKIRVDRNRLTIEVSDSGMGLAGCNQGTGLGNVSARLASLFGDAGHLALNSNAAGGATATITLPIPEQSA